MGRVEASGGPAHGFHAPGSRRPDSRQRQCVEVRQLEGITHETPGSVRDQDFVGLGRALEPCCQVWRLAHCQPGLAAASPGGAAHDHLARGDADAHGERLAVPDALDGLHDLQRRAHATLGIVLVRARPAEVDQQAISEDLRHVTVVLLHLAGQAVMKACITSRNSSGSRRCDRSVEPTRSQNMTVSCWRRSPGDHDGRPGRGCRPMQRHDCSETRWRAGGSGYRPV